MESWLGYQPWAPWISAKRMNWRRSVCMSIYLLSNYYLSIYLSNQSTTNEPPPAQHTSSCPSLLLNLKTPMLSDLCCPTHINHIYNNIQFIIYNSYTIQVGFPPRKKKNWWEVETETGRLQFTILNMYICEISSPAIKGQW